MIDANGNNLKVGDVVASKIAPISNQRFIYKIIKIDEIGIYIKMILNDGSLGEGDYGLQNSDLFRLVIDHDLVMLRLV